MLALLDFGGDNDGFRSRSGGKRRAADRCRHAVRAEAKRPYTSRSVVCDVEKLPGSVNSYSQDANANREWRTSDWSKPTRRTDCVARNFTVEERSGEKEAAFRVHAEAAWVGSGSERRACQGRGRAIDLVNRESGYGIVRRVSEVEEMAGRIEHHPKRILANPCSEWRSAHCCQCSRL